MVPRRIGIMIPIARYSPSKVLPGKEYSARAKAAMAPNNRVKIKAAKVTIMLFMK